jgi:hypothetical protein
MPEYTYYKIVCKDENIKDCYVGKTTNFKKRVWYHKGDCNNENSKIYNYKIYQYIRENGGINNWNFIEIEKGEYDNKDSALRERELIEKFNATLNIVIPTRTKKEWTKNYNKNYYEKNAEKIKEYYDKNVEIISEKQKRYKENNKEKIKEKAKEYYDKNAEIIKEKKREKIMCECGCEIRKDYLSTHLKSKKHIDLMS